MADIKTIPEGWIIATLREAIFPVSETFNFKETEHIHFLNTGDISNGKLLHWNFSQVSSLPGQAKKKFQKGDILYSEIRPENKRFMLVDFDSENSVASTKLMVLRTREGIDRKFIYQYLTSEDTIRDFQMTAESRSGTFPQITFDAISYFPLSLPPLLEQQAIARMLSSFDDKIELLREQNETLEKTAQTIFHEWFGKYRAEDELPDGWRVKKLGEIASLKSGFPFSGEDFIENSDVKVLKIKDLKGNGIVDSSDVSCVKNEVKEQERVGFFKLNTGDIVLAMSGNTTGKIGVIPENNNNLYLNQRVGKFFLKNKEHNSFLYFFLMSGNYEEKILNMGYGSAQPNINPSQIENIDIIFPEEKILKDYISISNGAFDKILQNHFQIQTLSKTRDELLPRLMNGEVRLKA